MILLEIAKVPCSEQMEDFARECLACRVVHRVFDLVLKLG